jgi:hypothetical protein
MTNKNLSISGSWEDNHNTIDVNLPLIVFEEDNMHVVYCPALDVSGYGITEAEATDSFQVALSEFFRYTTHKKTFEAELKRLGWQIKSRRKPMIPPTMAYLLSENENFSNIFNNFPFRKFNEAISLPA